MQIFGHYFFEDPEETAYLKQKEEKRMERVARQCERWGTQDEHTFWDITELPRGVFVPTEPTREDMKIHNYLMKKQECHIFYGNKFCYHKNGLGITNIEQ